jgi:hypothetical protein
MEQCSLRMSLWIWGYGVKIKYAQDRLRGKNQEVLKNEDLESRQKLLFFYLKTNYIYINKCWYFHVITLVFSEWLVEYVLLRTEYVTTTKLIHCRPNLPCHGTWKWAFCEAVRMRGGQDHGAFLMGLLPFEEEMVCTVWEYTKQEESPLQDLTRLTPWSRTSSLQNHENLISAKSPQVVCCYGSLWRIMQWRTPGFLCGTLLLSAGHHL